ncbi:uncharacterized protein LOC120631113 [Pararge aegeria]|uniref:Jg8967 protein n=1 Tax=Pararge aegeria aegeria TaxID=348720 RepID=A0A8S4QGF4_9NEOP|nr:uncharacterized protein LOC120631113 [Pararge aegeria]CAH2210501.1 jg8967 [Pararge aegeria aegeria]
MPLIDITNPAVIIFLIENYEKENRLRLNWIHKNWEQIQQAATLNRESTNYFETDVIAQGMIDGLPTITRDHIVAGYNRRKTPIRDGTFIPGVKNLRHGHSIIDVALGDPKEDPRLEKPRDDLTFDPVMRPIDPEIKSVIRKPKPEFGREQYLAKRSRIAPEKKYYFAECSSFEHGWRLKDSALRQKPVYGRCWHLNKALRTRVGPQPDPPHYKPSEPPGVNKCSAI